MYMLIFRNMYKYCMFWYIFNLCLPAAQKRHIFDQFGEEGLKSGAGTGGTSNYTFHGDPHQMFAQFFGGKDPFTMFGDGFDSATFKMFGDESMDFSPSGGSFMGAGPSGFSRMKRARTQQQDPPIEYPLLVTLEELFYGTTKKMKISRKVLNPDGTTSPQDKIVTINIKRGWKAGTKITYPREGDQSVGRTPADVVFVVQEKQHPQFTREGNDLNHTFDISLRDALCGTEVQVQVPTIEGANVHLPLNEIISPQTVRRIPGHGMPLSKQPDARGDLIVTFNIKFPKQLPHHTKEELAKLIPVV